MRVWKILLTFVLLAVWLPATVHCELEAAGVVPMDECCDSEAQGSHRCDTGCNTIEDGGYKTECHFALPTPPETLVNVRELCAATATQSVREMRPPEPFKIHHLPQFVIRTALPIRGPSIAS